MTNQILIFFIWYLLIAFFGFLVTPLVLRLFQNIPDRGYSVTKIVGLLIVAFIHWLLTSMGFLSNNQAGIWTAIMIAAGLVIWACGKSGIKESYQWINENKQIVIFIEVLFFLSLSLMTLIRSYSPDIWGTEKPMELMFINSILASDSFPPQDAWLSGFGISYYYFGYVMVAMIAKITGTSGSIAFNLGIALSFSLACLAVFGVVLNLISLQQLKIRFIVGRNVLRHSVFPALIAPVMLLIVGNFYGILEVFHQANWFSTAKVPSIWFDASKLDPNNMTSQSSGIFVGSRNFWDWMDLKQLPQMDDLAKPITSLNQPNWFFASRAIQDRDLYGQSWELIDEFPAFSFLLADLHPHVLALPFVILCVLLCLEWFEDRKTHEEEGLWLAKPNIVRILVSALILGSLIFLNTWDYPIYAFIFLLVGLMKNFPFEGKFHWSTLKTYFLRFLLPVFVLSIVFYLPFLISLQTQAGGILPNILYPSRFRQELVMFGPLMIPVSFFIGAYWIKRKELFDTRFGWRFSLTLFLSLIFIVVLLVVIVISLPQATNAITNMVYPFLWRDALKLIFQRRLVESVTLIFAMLVIFFSAGFLWGSRVKQKNSSLFVFVLIFTGALLLLGPELLYLRDQFGNRMNTVFKFYFQIWVLWSIASAYAIWFITAHSQKIARVVWVIGMSILVFTGLVYSLGTVNVTTNNFSREPNLDGLAYYYQNYPQDATVIDWIKQNVPHDSVILEGTRGAYWMEGRSSRISMATGIPTVMGWVNHESQWRGEHFSVVSNREEDIRTIYTSRDWSVVEPILESYGIDYILVSPEENQWYGTIDLSMFDQNLTRVFENGDLVLYQR